MIGLNISYPNYGYIGIPMCLMAFGAEAAIPLAFILLADTIVLLTFSSFFLALSNQKKSVSNISTICYNLVKSIVSQPLLISVCLGMVVSQFEIKITETVNVLIDTFAGGAAPVALIALGASITFKYPSHHELELIVISIGKLILHPCLIILVFYLWPNEVTDWDHTAIL